MAVKTLNVSLTETLVEFIGERIRSCEYSNASDYVRDLVRTDLQEKRGDRLATFRKAFRGGAKQPETQKEVDLINARIRAARADRRGSAIHRSGR